VAAPFRAVQPTAVKVATAGQGSGEGSGSTTPVGGSGSIGGGTVPGSSGDGVSGSGSGSGSGSTTPVGGSGSGSVGGGTVPSGSSDSDNPKSGDTGTKDNFWELGELSNNDLGELGFDVSREYWDGLLEVIKENLPDLTPAEFFIQCSMANIKESYVKTLITKYNNMIK
jgi:hypothetical protein